MGVDSGLFLKYCPPRPGVDHPTLPQMLQALADLGWRVESAIGTVSYWVNEETFEAKLGEKQAVIDRLVAAYESGSKVTLTMRWRDQRTYCCFWFTPPDEWLVAYVTGKIKLSQCGRYADHSWYINRILPALLRLDMHVHTVEASDSW
jgi:hypothetical protein